MKNRIFILVMLSSLFLVACQSKSTENKFTGGTDIWSAELHTVNNQENKFVLKYKEDPRDIDNIDEFKLNAPNWTWGMGDINLDNEGIGIYMTEDIDTDKFSTSESDIIEVEIKWNDKVDIFTLKSE